MKPSLTSGRPAIGAIRHRGEAKHAAIRVRMHALPRRLRDDARHERPSARSVSEMRWLTAPQDLRAEDQSLQLFEPDRGEIREGFRARRNCQGTGAAEGLRADLAPATSPA